MHDTQQNEQVKKSNTVPKIIIVTVVLLLAAGLVGFNIYKNKQDKNVEAIYAKDAVEVSVGKTFTDTVKNKISVKGSVDLREKVTFYPTTQTGIIEMLDVEVGDKIEEGKTILTYKDDAKKKLEKSIEDADIAIRSAQASLNSITTPVEASDVEAADAEIKAAENRVLAAELGISQAEASLEQSERKYNESVEDLNKNKILLDAGVLSSLEFDKMERSLQDLEDSIATQKENISKLYSDLALAKDSVTLAKTAKESLLNKNQKPAVKNQQSISKIQVEQAQHTKEKLLEDMGDLVLSEEAPISGTVLELYAEEGATVSQASPLLVIADLDSSNLVIKSNIPERDATDIAVGQPVEIKLGDIRDTVYEGIVSKVHPVAQKLQTGANTYETMVPIEIDILTKDTNLKSGYTIDVDIVTSEYDDAIMVPLTATIIGDNEQYVYVVNMETYTLEKYVIIPISYSGDSIEVEGIPLDVWVVTNPDSSLREGMSVKPLGGF